MTDWGSVFRPDTPLLEIVARGSVMYLSLFVLLRVILKRESGTTGVTNLLVIVLLADAAQNGMADDYRSVTDGVLLVAVIIGWSYLLDVLAYWWPAAARVIRPNSLVLVQDGRILRRNLRREFITDEELHSELREQGIADLSEVREVRMEPDGQFSVIPAGGDKPRKKSRRGPAG
ncbi:Uncharacterized membrane protein YcaP, DUF421 family [Micromonospora echinaurantiaca]|uniref:Uncharacterized membrane protein YcaP, DUF421 family n=1 Tax=Micromonospora echinaurantiaca TaxID=47857 RepID=A0A1C5KCC7_9ACTN|nr:YetF domain-containing protein [Micromonospora echinaurantiaca]SCG80452.1 Uncharacterized membrane protein YcaP, DUF421 family [Micromonospora echinaurantiaca]